MSKKIVIDPGHGGIDPGAVGHVTEKNINLTISKLLADKLAKSTSAIVKLTRNKDITLTLPQRVKIANDFNADLFLSLHSNAGGGSGYEDYVYSGSLPQITTNIRKIIHKHTSSVWVSAGRPNRGMKNANFFVLRQTKMSAVLIENGFVDNVIDSSLLEDKVFLNKLTDGLLEGIIVALQLSPSKKGLWINQVGAFSKYENAINQKNKLESLGFPVYTYYNN